MENVSISCMKSTDSFMNQIILEISFTCTGIIIFSETIWSEVDPQDLLQGQANLGSAWISITVPVFPSLINAQVKQLSKPLTWWKGSSKHICIRNYLLWLFFLQEQGKCTFLYSHMNQQSTDSNSDRPLERGPKRWHGL